MSTSRRSSVRGLSKQDVKQASQGRRPMSFFEKSPAGNHARGLYLKTVIGGTFAMIILIFTVLAIYWAAFYKTPVRNLHGWVVDFDGGVVGQMVSQALASNQGPGRITWEVVPATAFPGGPEELAHAIRHEDAWTAVSINPGASDRLTAAISFPDPSYDGAQAITGYGVEARNENAFRVFIRPSLQGTLDAISRGIAVQTAQRLANYTALPSIMVTSPQTIVAPIYYTINNLIPFDQPVATAATFVGMLLQLILGFFVVMIAHGAREISGYDRTLSVRALVILRLVTCFVAYFILSLCFTLLNIAFLLDVGRKFGHGGGFMALWMINYIGMLAVVLALESLITLLTPKGIPFFMLLWIISNLAVSIFPLEALPVVFRYGYGAPFYNLSKAIRVVVFGTRNRIGLSVGVLFAWIAISCITLSIFQWFTRRGSSSSPAPSSSSSEESVATTGQDGLKGDTTILGRVTREKEATDRELVGVA